MLHYRKIHTNRGGATTRIRIAARADNDEVAAAAVTTTTSTARAAAGATDGFERSAAETGCSVGNDNAEDKEVVAAAAAATAESRSRAGEGFLGLRECPGDRRSAVE